MFGKTMIMAAVVALGATAASASTVTLGYKVTGLSGSGLAFLGLSSGDTISGSVTYDDTFSYGPVSHASSAYDYDVAYDQNVTQSLSIGGNDYSSTSFSNYAYFIDGKQDKSYDIYDYFYTSFNSVLAGSNGITSSNGYVYGYDFDETTFSGFSPTDDELNALDYKYFYLNFTANGNRYTLRGANVEFHLSEVPLPASGFALLTGLALAWGVKRRKS